jgi:acetyl-CoA acyltransferase
MLVTTPEHAAAQGWTPIARYVAGAVAGANPVLMLTGPIPATAKVLGKTGLGIGDIGVFEVNEAFAPVPLAWRPTPGPTRTGSTHSAGPSRSATRWADPVRC